MGCPCHRTPLKGSVRAMHDRTGWMEVEVIQEAKLIVPEWDTVRVHVGQKLKLPPQYVADHAEWFLVAGKPVKGKGYTKAILDLKSPKEA